MTKSKKELLDKFRLEEAKREKRLAFDRSVYAYRAKHSVSTTDNLLLLPRASESAHREFLRVKLAGFGPDILSRFDDYSLVRIGHFNVRTLNFHRCSPTHVLDIHDIIVDLNKVLKK